MIRYYTYYSCGGYKDTYIGSDKDSVQASYFIPLFNVWKKSNKPEHSEKIALAESVQQVELITKSNSAGFPSECNMMFSHGGYSAIYRTLNDGRVCLCIRDIPNGTKDEEGRDIPFNFLFLADGQESIDKLEGLSLGYLKKEKEINTVIADAISYDPVVNGIKFDLIKLDNLVVNYKVSSCLLHEVGTVDYMKISSRQQASMALKEQGLTASKVKSLWDSEGVFYGHLQYRIEQSLKPADDEPIEISQDSSLKDSTSEIEEPIVEKHTDVSDSPQDKQIVDDNCIESEPKVITEKSNDSEPDKSFEQEKVSDVSAIIEAEIQQIEQRLSLLAKTDDVKDTQSLLEKIANDNHTVLNNILSKLSNLEEHSESREIVHHNALQPILKNIYIIGGICLIVGFVLGALIL